MPPTFTTIEFQVGDRRWRAEPARATSLAIPLAFDGEQPVFFAAPQASSAPLHNDSFIGDIAQGGSCRCVTHTFTPHCNGTHTECIGHVVSEAVSVENIAPLDPQLALLLTVAAAPAQDSNEHSSPPANSGDRWITAAALESAAESLPKAGCTALIIRTLPNPPDKRHWRYDAGPHLPPYFSSEAMAWIVDRGIEHLVVDLPSLDRAADAGHLTGHRLFWGLPAGSTALSAARRPHATVTELAYVDDSLADGLYALTLQVAPFVSDASPSRPIVYPLMDIGS